MRKKRKFYQTRFYRTNQYIQAKKLRVITEKGENLGVLEKEEALKIAKEKGLDLIEIAPKASPPVCKIIDFRKFKYEQSKKQQKSKKKGSRPEIKEIRISLFMAEHDFQRRIEQAKKFLKEGEIVKFRLFFKGRQNNKKDFGLERFRTAKEVLTEFSNVSQEPIIKGKILEMTLKPKL